MTQLFNRKEITARPSAPVVMRFPQFSSINESRFHVEKIKTLFTIDGVITSFVGKIVDENDRNTIIFGEIPVSVFLSG